ncbi:2Fe-2S iron-sulfur cluster binding domain-containing protein [Coleofasciculus sp. FACHB-64]|nr:2Fe-2S iron-sulfur cluster binding domain-containing protein [Coleofasciculus sp. FACHB-501]MBD2044691.1 2Fe-2S iron-sulfur cluster binding domain-containing protein [Coleofasciculus sp. FACHB-64]
MRLRITRRRFGMLTIASTLVVAKDAIASRIANANLTKNIFMQTSPKTSTAVAKTQEPGRIDVTLRINGKSHTLRIEPRVTLLDALRERIGLTGTKKGCDRGQCGACTVLVDGRRINSCLTLAVMQEGAEITTIEGLARGDELHPMQAAFIKHDGFQCGYCTPGQIVSAVGLLAEGCPTSDEGIRECMSGNLCRCGAYPGIVAAVREVHQTQTSNG